MKKILVLSIFALLVVGGGYFVFSKSKPGVLGSPSSGITKTLFGLATNAVSVPRSQVEANATSTDASTVGNSALVDGGNTIQQSLLTGGADFVWLTGLVKAGTATSSIYIAQQGAFEEEGTWFDVHASSTPSNLGYVTTTPILLTPAGVVFAPGLATSSFALPFYTRGFPFTRFLFYADDLTTDSIDGVQAFIQATPIKQIP